MKQEANSCEPEEAKSCILSPEYTCPSISNLKRHTGRTVPQVHGADKSSVEMVNNRKNRRSIDPTVPLATEVNSKHQMRFQFLFLRHANKYSWEWKHREVETAHSFYET